MMNKKILILGIESSCDETSAAVISRDEKGDCKVLSNVIYSSSLLALRRKVHPNHHEK